MESAKRLPWSGVAHRGGRSAGGRTLSSRRVYECALSNSADVESKGRGEFVVAAAEEALELEEHCRCSQVDFHRDEAARSGCTQSGKQQRRGSLREATRRSIGRRVVGKSEVVISGECNATATCPRGGVPWPER